jgi:hypothetical protein
VPQFRYLGTITKKNQNLILVEIKGRLNSGNACCLSIQKLLSPLLMSKNLKIKMYKTIIFPVVLYVYETWALTLRKELRVSEKRMPRKIFGMERDEVVGGWRKLRDEKVHNLHFRQV